MKPIIALFFLFTISYLPAQTLEQAANAFGKGEADKISTWMEADVEMALLNGADLYTRAEATTRLKGFFAKFPPKGVSIMHQGTSKNSDSRFIIAQLNAGSERFRLYLYGEQSGNGFKLAEIRIERE